jgi:two-component sensor histidine kinase
MTTRARQLLQRSRDLLERSRVAAVQLLDPPRGQAATLPRVIEGSRGPMTHHEPEGAVVDICASIALRDLNLVDSLLALLERMEENKADPERLSELYKLDHLAARLRRNAENLRVLAGRDASDAMSDSASIVDVIRAAMSSIAGYSRVSIGRVLALGVVGIAAEDLSRLLAELLDNAAKQSPPDSTVRVSAHLTESGSVLLRIEDDGIGMPAERVAELNSRLSDEPTLTDDSVRHMGLAVVRRLAARHDMRVRIDRRSPHGTTATVLLPTGLLCELPDTAWSGAQTVTTPPAVADPVPPAVPAPPSPRRPKHAAAAQPGTAGGLPRRGGTATRPRPRPQEPAAGGGQTVNGLPRRVSRSIRNPDHGDEAGRAPQPRPEPGEPSGPGGHEKLLADLDAFAAGEAEAKADAKAEPRAEAEPESVSWPDDPGPDTSPSNGQETPPGRTTP